MPLISSSDSEEPISISSAPGGSMKDLERWGEAK